MGFTPGKQEKNADVGLLTDSHWDPELTALSREKLEQARIPASVVVSSENPGKGSVMGLEVCIGMCGRAGGGDSLTETRGSRSHWQDTVEMWAVWE